jgi:DNA ligase-associated metallophosphoesterase
MALEFTLGHARLTALPSGALLWRAENLLCVSDLHLGKSQRMARRAGTLLPPYEVAETLAKLHADLAKYDAKTVVCLGDSFDDLMAGFALDARARAQLAQLQAGREWVWIEGNHDAGPLDLGGAYCPEYAQGGVVFRHIAQANLPDNAPEISGHYHPKARLAGQFLPAFWAGGGRLIMPAYGAYTGGMRAEDAPVRAYLGGGAIAMVCRAERVLRVPLG